MRTVSLISKWKKLRLMVVARAAALPTLRTAPAHLEVHAPSFCWWRNRWGRGRPGLSGAFQAVNKNSTPQLPASLCFLFKWDFFCDGGVGRGEGLSWRHGGHVSSFHVYQNGRCPRLTHPPPAVCPLPCSDQPANKSLIIWECVKLC